MPTYTLKRFEEPRYRSGPLANQVVLVFEDESQAEAFHVLIPIRLVGLLSAEDIMEYCRLHAVQHTAVSRGESYEILKDSSLTARLGGLVNNAVRV